MLGKWIAPSAARPGSTAAAGTPATRCKACAKLLTGDDGEEARRHGYCRECFKTSPEYVGSSAYALTTGINYPMAVTGALLGGFLGSLLWWGVAVASGYRFGLIAVAIGFAVGLGTSLLAGRKRSVGLGVLALVVTLLAYVSATYLVNATFINRSVGEAGTAGMLPLFTIDLGLFLRVVTVGFGMMDLVFLGIALWTAWGLAGPPRYAA
jgi:hypothetical protein